MRARLLVALLLVSASGCSQQQPGSEASARKHFDAEFRKWMSGAENEVSTLMSRLESHKKPISYNVRSVVPDEPHWKAKVDGFKEKGQPEKVEGEWTAWKFNVVIESESEAGTPVEKVTTYTLTWNPHSQKWTVNERL